MRPNRLVPLLLFILVSLAGAQLALAQDLSVLDDGKPMSDISIVRFVNDQKTVVATTDASGNVEIPLDVLDFGKGEEVQVWVRRCTDGRVELTLTRVDEENPNVHEQADAGEGCRCEKLGLPFFWGGGPVNIDVTRGTVDQQTYLGMGPRIGETFAIGIKFNVSNMLQLEDVAGDAPGATASEATTWAPGVALFFEMTPWGPVALGVAGTYSQMETKTSFGSLLQTGDINYYSVGPYTRVDLGKGFRTGMTIVPFLELALAYAWNRGDFSVDGLSEQREHETWRGEFGGGLYHYSTPNFGIILQALYSTTGEDNDADEHFRIGGGILWRPFSQRILP
jgi:hypothetical protein